jgi:hypothetical protein
MYTHELEPDPTPNEAITKIPKGYEAYTELPDTLLINSEKVVTLTHFHPEIFAEFYPRTPSVQSI